MTMLKLRILLGYPSRIVKVSWRGPAVQVVGVDLLQNMVKDVEEDVNVDVEVDEDMEQPRVREINRDSKGMQAKLELAMKVLTQ